MSALCPSGHASDEDDYCSVCGAAIVKGRPSAAVATLRGPSGPVSNAGACPSCGELREDPDGRFCEVCRYDFHNQKLGPPPVAKKPTSTPAPPKVDPPKMVAPTATKAGWRFVVTIDPALDTDPDPESPCPGATTERVFSLDAEELLVGRHDDHRDIHPDIPLHDPGSSRRHAKFVRDADGGVALLDLASTNGTTLNGAVVAAGSRRVLNPGDEVTIGRWTRIVVRNAS